MRSTQDKVLAQIEQKAAEYGLEVVIDYRYANTGMLRVEDPNDFEPVLSFGFQFNTASFELFEITPHLPEFPDRVRTDSYKRVTQQLSVFSPPKTYTAEQVLKAIANALARDHNVKVEAEINA